MNQLIGSDGALSPEAVEVLRNLAAIIIPASPEHELPGADDPDIFAGVLAAARSAGGFLEESLRTLSAEAGEALVSTDWRRRLAAAEAFRAGHPDAAGLIVSLLCQCFYRDPRVLESLGMPARPPFPEGYEVPAGDWSLLDPVRARDPFYRDV